MLTRERLPVRAFTLVELMIVVAIIGLLAVLAIPSMQKAREEGRVSRYCHDLRLVTDAFEMYAMANGRYPADVNRGVIPPGMEPYLPKMDWRATPLGGVYDWERRSFGFEAGVSTVESTAPQELFRRVDRVIDDGVLTTGRFQFVNDDRYTYIIQP